MTMRKGTTTTIFGVCIMVMAMMLIGNLELSMAQEEACSVNDLSSCAFPVLSGGKPSEKCCSDLKKQPPKCLCQFLNDPNYKDYAENARKTFKACGVQPPC
ncbi:non-specific lipid-transfer protein 2P-like [Ipomoea triloba]|uniref:non-specific lipid-transfer protein 2P-like n=1 Tax=Ipomoea triloba TaxID=35885 RepID=UPI00125D4191|nr:non-specific lipid-transfer protein 2P-like [Ipomoea triloba]